MPSSSAHANAKAKQQQKQKTQTEKQQSQKRASSLRVVAANTNVSIESLDNNNYNNRCDNKMLWALILYTIASTNLTLDRD